MPEVLAIGAAVGLVLGLTGAGGSLFAVPLLMLGLGLATGQATGLALGAVAVSAAWGAAGGFARREVVWLPALVLALSGALLAPVGRALALQLPDIWLMAGFAVLVIWVALRMWLQARREPAAAGVTRASQAPKLLTAEQPLCRFSASGQLELRPRCLAGVVLGGAMAGVLSGLFGVGGGFVIVPLLVLLTGLSMRAAVATSLLVIAVISTSGFASYLWLGHAVNYAVLAWLSLGGVLGMVLGSKLAHRLAGPVLQQIFVVLMILLTASALWLQWRAS
ncbi:sulfite exporter TauE/SafE family protein [Simiduia sp. 21SJ11W-1]|uniref:sulfite exporter TauE/SafE family protein n=1 Tax=Simiduia sp. 21SJ11W-1 TaxID=2909669 RepID=UPI00209EE382|nr:sulfite exporter TauE/SafE family protein [Simiduia sp. 21SJ11W-1]UTA48975.1 sulfite exporter TauE/SafE family protein [Simiduia sp. 21SJ11W-1]